MKFETESKLKFLFKIHFQSKPLKQTLKISVNSLQVLYMDAVQHIPDDIQDIVDLMTEKEIRLHAPLEEIELLQEC